MDIYGPSTESDLGARLSKVMLPQQDLSKDMRHQRIDTRPRQYRINLDQTVSECLRYSCNSDIMIELTRWLYLLMMISMINLEVVFAVLMRQFGLPFFGSLGNRSTTPSTRSEKYAQATFPRSVLSVQSSALVILWSWKCSMDSTKLYYISTLYNALQCYVRYGRECKGYLLSINLSASCGFPAGIGRPQQLRLLLLGISFHRFRDSAWIVGSQG